MKKITYATTGTCSRFIELTGEDGRIVDVAFYGGCNGNLQGISSLVKGMRYEIGRASCRERVSPRV